MINEKQNFLKNIAEVGKNILAHVNITYNGATGQFHIDITPTDAQNVIVEENQKAIGQSPEVKALPQKAESRTVANRTEGAEGKKPDSITEEAAITDTDQ